MTHHESSRLTVRNKNLTMRLLENVQNHESHGETISSGILAHPLNSRDHTLNRIPLDKNFEDQKIGISYNQWVRKYTQP